MKHESTSDDEMRRRKAGKDHVGRRTTTKDGVGLADDTTAAHASQTGT